MNQKSIFKSKGGEVVRKERHEVEIEVGIEVELENNLEIENLKSSRRSC